MTSNNRSTLIAPILLAACLAANAQSPEPPSPAGNVESSLTTASNPQTEEASTTKAYAQPQKAAEVTNSIFESIKVGERPFYNGSGLYALGGAFGGLIAATAWKDEPDRIAGFVKQESIDVAALVKTEFEHQFEQSEKSKQVYDKNGPAKFQMEIVYGITSVPFSSDYRPYLSIRMKLVDSNGAEKWKDREYMGRNSKAPAIPYPDFFKSSKEFTSEFEAVAKEVVKLLLDNFSR